jgi:3-oxoacyl-[acyl-carrier protein] reductase
MSGADLNISVPLSGRTALVTGGSRGIGAGIGRALAAQGARVVLCGRDEDALARVAADIRAKGGEVAIGTGDVTNEADVIKLKRTAEAAFGEVELLVVAAGGAARGGPLADESVDVWRKTVETNLTSAFLTLKTFLPPMYAHGRGAVVLISSSAARQVSEASVSYAASKAALLTLMAQAASEAAPRGVRINAIAPSAIVTERWAAQAQAMKDVLARQFPLGRLGAVNDVAAATLFLLSDAASWITGVTLDVAGGKSGLQRRRERSPSP